jgi:transcriptional regulator with XRE-family HTH domain
MNGEAVRTLLAANLKRYRTKMGLSQEKLAEAADISTNYLSALETGRKWPYPETLAGLADALGIPVSQFFAAEGVPDGFLDSVAQKASTALSNLDRINALLDAALEKHAGNADSL